MGQPVIHEKMWFVIRAKTQHYHSENPENLAYLTHFDTNKAFEKRKDTGVHWAYRTKEDNPGEAFDNVPVNGFRVIKHAVRWSTSNVAWRIEDPRGFSCEIYSDNMASLLQETVIGNGRIGGKCVWGRVAGKNFLIPCESETYQLSLAHTQKVGEPPKKVKMKDVSAGDTVQLRSGGGRSYIYMGKGHAGQFSHYRKDEISLPKEGSKKEFVYYDIGSKDFISYASNTMTIIEKKVEGEFGDEEIAKLNDSVFQNYLDSKARWYMSLSVFVKEITRLTIEDFGYKLISVRNSESRYCYRDEYKIEKL